MEPHSDATAHIDIPLVQNAVHSCGSFEVPGPDDDDVCVDLLEESEDAIHQKSKHKWTKAQTVLLRATVLATIFMCLEIVGGYISGSVSIISDAAHMFSDVSGYIIALGAAYLSTRGVTKKYPYGYKRVEVLGALLSVASIWVVTVWLMGKAIHRLVSPEDVKEKVMVTTAALGIAFNCCIFWVLGAQHHHHFGMPCSHAHGHGHSHGGQSSHAHGGSDTEDASDHAHCSHGHGHSHGLDLRHRHCEQPGLHGATPCTGSHAHGHGSKEDHHGHGHSHEAEEDHHVHGHSHAAKEDHHGHGHSHAAKEDHHGHAHSAIHDHCNHSHTTAQGQHGHGHSHATAEAHHGHGHSHATAEAHHGHGHSHATAEAHHGHCNSHSHADGDMHHSNIMFEEHRGCGHNHNHGHGDGDEGDEHQNLNVRGAVLHALGDLLQSIGVLIAGIIMWAFPGCWWADPVMTLGFSVIVFWTTRPIVKDITNILMQRAPDSVCTDKLEKDLMALQSVKAVYKLSVWSLSSAKNVMTAHVKVGSASDAANALREIERVCRTYQIHDTTIQVEAA